MGGHDGGYDPLDSVERYDPAADVWEAVARTPHTEVGVVPDMQSALLAI